MQVELKTSHSFMRTHTFARLKQAWRRLNPTRKQEVSFIFGVSWGYHVKYLDENDKKIFIFEQKWNTKRFKTWKVVQKAKLGEGSCVRLGIMFLLVCIPMSTCLSSRYTEVSRASKHFRHYLHVGSAKQRLMQSSILVTPEVAFPITFWLISGLIAI